LWASWITGEIILTEKTEGATGWITWKRVRQVLVGFFIFVVAFLYLRSYLELVRMEYQISVVEREIAVWEERCNELLEQIEYLSSDEYVEKMAREKLGLVKPGEVQFIVTDPASSHQRTEVEERPGTDPSKIRD
jgi:cell division protein DivIC